MTVTKIILDFILGVQLILTVNLTVILYQINHTKRLVFNS